jgi:multiple sugar transport system permease protein
MAGDLVRAAAIAPQGAAQLTRSGRARVSKADHRRLRRRYEFRRSLVAMGFLAPNLIFFVVFLVLPLTQVFVEMFQTGGLIRPITFVGFDNWERVTRDPNVLRTLANTMKYAVIIIPTMLVLGLLIALVLQNVTRGAAVFRALIYLPVLAPTVIVGLIWLFLLDPDLGAYDLLLRLVGVKPQLWLGSTELALPSVAAMEIWRSAPFWALYFLAALIGMPRELYQAAHLDGANAWNRFRFVTLPLMRRVFLFALVLATIFVLQIFDSVYVLTDGGPAGTTTTLVWYIYHALFFFFRIGFGASMAVLLLVIILTLSLIQMRLLRRRGGV